MYLVARAFLFIGSQFLLMGGFIVFVIYAIVNSRRQEKINKETQKTKEKRSDKK